MAVRDTTDGMNRIREQTQETAKQLGKTSQEISQIVQLIDDIADRSGILTLNTSILSRRTGDQG